MITFELTCFHKNEDLSEMKEYKMVPSDLLEFNRIVFECPECKREVFLKIDFEGITGKIIRLDKND